MPAADRRHGATESVDNTFAEWGHIRNSHAAIILINQLNDRSHSVRSGSRVDRSPFQPVPHPI